MAGMWLGGCDRQSPATLRLEIIYIPAEADFLPRSWRTIVQSSTGDYVQLSLWDGIAFVTFIVLVVGVLLAAPPAAS